MITIKEPEVGRWGYCSMMLCQTPNCVSKPTNHKVIDGHIFDLCDRHYAELLEFIKQDYSKFRFQPDTSS